MQELQKSFISIVIPTFDRPDYLRSCLESIASQTSQDFELVVVCNGSFQSTYNLIEEFQMRLPTLKIVSIKENIWSWNDFGIYYRGVYKRGLEACTGEFVLFLSDDDSLSDTFVEKVLRVFLSNPECVAVTVPGINKDLVTGCESPVMSTEYINKRPKIEDGKELALRYFSARGTDRADLTDPGFGYVILTSLWRNESLQGSIWDGFEVEQYRFLLPHGLVGFEAETRYFWGRHPNQANKLLNNQIGMLRTYALQQRSSELRSLKFWATWFGADWSKRLKKAYRIQRFPRSLQFLWRNSPYLTQMRCDVIVVSRRPQEIVNVFRTDAREAIFWILLPQTVWYFCVIAFRKGLSVISSRLELH